MKKNKIIGKQEECLESTSARKATPAGLLEDGTLTRILKNLAFQDSKSIKLLQKDEEESDVENFRLL